MRKEEECQSSSPKEKGQPFHVGDIVIVNNIVNLIKKDGSTILMENRQGEVLFCFTDVEKEQGCVIDFGDFQTPFQACDLQLVEAASEPADDTPAPVSGRVIGEDIYKALMRLGILDTSVRSYNRGASDYSQHIIQPWSIWLDYNLNPWDADIVKRILRTKEGDSRRLDYDKIIHICEERIRQLDMED